MIIKTPQVHINFRLGSQILKLNKYLTGRFCYRLSLVKPAQLRKGFHVSEPGPGSLQWLAGCSKELRRPIIGMYSSLEVREQILRVRLNPERDRPGLILCQIFCELFGDLTDVQCLSWIIPFQPVSPLLERV